MNKCCDLCVLVVGNPKHIKPPTSPLVVWSKLRLTTHNQPSRQTKSTHLFTYSLIHLFTYSVLLFLKILPHFKKFEDTHGFYKSFSPHFKKLKDTHGFYKSSEIWKILMGLNKRCFKFFNCWIYEVTGHTPNNYSFETPALVFFSPPFLAPKYATHFVFVCLNTSASFDYIFFKWVLEFLSPTADVVK